MTKINDFTDSNPVQVESAIHPGCGKLVYLTQFGGSMHFQHSMTPIQARELAAALVAEANQLEMQL